MDLIWRSKKIIKFSANLIWRSEEKIKFGDFCHFAPVAPNFLPAKIYPNKVFRFGQMKEYNKRNIFLQNYAENKVGRLVPDLFIF